MARSTVRPAIPEPLDARWVAPDDLVVSATQPLDSLRLLDLTSITDWSDPGLLAAVRQRPERALVLGMHAGPLPAEATAVTRQLTCTVVPAGRASAQDTSTVGVEDIAGAADLVARRCCHRPRATRVLDGLLALTARLDVEGGVLAESLAYSLLQRGPEFGGWLTGRSPRTTQPEADPVRLHRGGGGELEILLAMPGRRNAIGAALRAALVDALDLVAGDPGVHAVLSGEGPCFSSGGDVGEFGLADDGVAAHAVRLQQSPGLALHRVRTRVTCVLHGDCIGAGIEIPAFSAHVVARRGTTARLPELEFGLVPGAGGTVSIQQRIGRWRTAWMVLSGLPLETDDLLAWGLVDEVAA